MKDVSDNAVVVLWGPGTTVATTTCDTDTCAVAQVSQVHSHQCEHTV